jgi:hypothetical protein
MEKKNKQNNNPGKNGSQPARGSNKTLWWILGGCLVLLLIGGLVIGGIAHWSWKKVKREIKEKQQKLEQVQNQVMQENANANAGKYDGAPTGSTSIPEEPVAIQNPGNSDVPSDIYPPAVTEKAIGYLKKVYTKGGKNYLSIDYVQWLTGDAAEKAMREDGQCPKKGECIVLNDYYIRNQNPLIRTFEVAPDAEILAHDFSADYSTGNWNQSWTFSGFSNYFNKSANNGYWDSVPFHVEIGNNQILKITEQYIP